MRSSLQPDRLILSDAPGCFWLFGGFFCIVGGLAIAAAFASRSGPLWQLLLGLFFGIVGLATGILFIYQSPSTRVHVRFAEGIVEISRRGFLRRQFETYEISAIQAAYLVQGKDIDGDLVFTLRMQLKDGREIPLTLLWLPARERLATILQQLSPYIPMGEARVADP